MTTLSRCWIPLLALAAAFVFAPGASAQDSGPQLHRLADGDSKLICENYGNRDLKVSIRNVGNCPIRVRWFSKQDNQWHNYDLQPGQRYRGTVQFGERLRVHDIADHHDSKFGSHVRFER